MNNLSVIEVLQQTKALQNGHFILSSGKHSREYVQCQKVLQYPNHGLAFARMLCTKFQGLKINVVIGPALGAVHFELFLAIALNEANNNVRGLFAEKVRKDNETIFELRRGQELNPGDNVLIVEDVVTTGNSALKIYELVKSFKANPVAVASIIDRTPDVSKFAIPFYSLLQLTLEAYDPFNCPLCAQNLALVKPGSSV